MAELLTQEQVEREMYIGGIRRAENMMANSEAKGSAVNNPYAKNVLADYVLPISQAIQQGLVATRAGSMAAHVALLRPLDADAVALLVVRTALNTLLEEGDTQLRRLGYAIGRTVHNELVLAQIEQHNPDLYFTLAHDFNRRLSKDERHRMTVFKMQAAKAGIEVVEWPVGARDQVGLYLLGLLETAGMVVIEPEIRRGIRTTQAVVLSPSLLEKIDEIKAYVAVTMPMYGPCVEPPRDWADTRAGGFHTREMRRAHHSLVRHRLARTALYREAQMPTVLAAVNALQRTRWQVNARMLDAILAVGKAFSSGEITSLTDQPKPPKPPWLETGMDKAAFSEAQTAELKTWKRAMTAWHTERKVTVHKYGRFYTATRSAAAFRDYPAIYFVYFADSRGRLYPLTYGMNPQGSDLQKALLHFAEGMPLDTPEAIRWFHVQGANKWGFDKATLAERHKWVVDRQDLLLSFASDPVNNTGWKDAGDPLQFLAWCLEYRDWVEDTSGSFLSHLPISMDGSCNGLQNLSALLRDEIGGQATNLTANTVMEDIYRRVAEAAVVRMTEAPPYEDVAQELLRAKWIAHGISRSVVKRSVMTTPYGVTKRSAIDYVVEDYLKKGEAKCFEPEEFMRAAVVLMDFAWPAIGDVVVKGREAMDWLQKSARAIMKTVDPDDPIITWISPSGFPAAQAYYEMDVHRINTRLHGTTKIRVVSESDTPDSKRHANGLAPNFVHSMDAAHLHLTTEAAAAAGIDSLAMIHDDYGTHAANAEKLFQAIREQFVRMYEEHDPITAFAERYPCVPKAPTKGGLDIREVLTSDFFFS